MKAVMISIQPKWVEKIVNGEKTIEVRKTAPKIDTPFKCYIYKTKATKLWSVIHKGDHFYGQTYDKTEILSFPDIDGGKVIGEFVCDRIYEWTYDCNVGEYNIGKNSLNRTCLLYRELENYGKGKTLYGLHISDLKIYDEPKELSEFKNLKGEPITRAFQSWGYMEI